VARQCNDNCVIASEQNVDGDDLRHCQPKGWRVKKYDQDKHSKHLHISQSGRQAVKQSGSVENHVKLVAVFNRLAICCKRIAGILDAPIQAWFHAAD
jgi:hypothetical protein